LGIAALYPLLMEQWAIRRTAQRLARVEARLEHRDNHVALDPALSLRVQRLSALLASWETVGGCGAGSTGGAGTVKWIGHSTTGGLFQDVTQLNYIHLSDGYNLIATTQLSRDIDEQWTVGVFVPFVYKRYNNYMGLAPPVDVANSGFGDVNLLGTFRFGPINATSLTASLGLPTGTHDARYRNDLLTQEKQLGLGKVTGSLTLDHTIDESWGLIVLGGLVGYRGGMNELKYYRAPLGSVYGYAGYFVGPLVPVLGVALTGFLGPDRDRTLDQDVPLLLVSPNASIEWSTDWIAVLAGVSLPIGLYAKTPTGEGVSATKNATGLQPWTAAIGVSVSPF
jgi:hypothetical protein